MATKRNPNRKKAFEVYKEYSGDISLVEILRQLKIPPGTIRGWKSKDKWEQKLNGTFQSNKQNVPKKKNNVTKKKEPIAEEVKSVLENNNLTDKQRLFCLYYTKYFNATKAYLKAYECDYITANTNGPRLLVNACVKDEINRLKQGKLNKAMFDETDLFQMYLDIATANINDFVDFGTKEITALSETGIPLLDEEGNEITYLENYINFKQGNEVDGFLISEVSQGRNGAKIKLQDKMKAMDWIDKNMGLATEEQKARISKLKAEAKQITEKDKEAEPPNITIIDRWADDE